MSNIAEKELELEKNINGFKSFMEYLKAKEEFQEEVDEIEKVVFKIIQKFKAKKVCGKCTNFFPVDDKKGWGECEILSSCNYGKLTKETDTCPCCIIHR